MTKEEQIDKREQLIISKVNQLNKSLAKQTKLMLFICGELIKLSKGEL